MERQNQKKIFIPRKYSTPFCPVCLVKATAHRLCFVQRFSIFFALAQLFEVDFSLGLRPHSRFLRKLHYTQLGENKTHRRLKFGFFYIAHKIWRPVTHQHVKARVESSMFCRTNKISKKRKKINKIKRNRIAFDGLRALTCQIVFLFVLHFFLLFLGARKTICGKDAQEVLLSVTIIPHQNIDALIYVLNPNYEIIVYMADTKSKN